MNATKAIFKTFFLSLCVIANIHFAFAQTTGGIIPNGQNVFLDNNGKPLSGGKVFFYTGNVGSTVPKTTFQDINLTTPNTNPVILDASGRPHSGTGLWGTGNYRQVVQDKNNNLIWDVLTSAAGSGSSGGGETATGDGDLVGTIKPWAGMIAPNQYMFAYGAQISRTTFSALFTAITSAQSVFCNSGSPILNGLGDTTNFWIGMTVEVSCVPAGVSTVLSKTSNSITLNTNANVTLNTNATFFPWGNGNGINTFTLPDLRGVVPMGNNIMGGVASSNMSDINFGPQGASSSGALGGNQSEALLLSNQASIIPSGSIVVTNGAISVSAYFSGGGQFLGSGGAAVGIQSLAATQATSTATFTGNSAGGGIAVSSTIVAAGSTYPVSSSVTLTVVGGTCSIAPQFTVSTSGGGALTGTPTLLTAGQCSVVPSNPVATTSSGTGTGGTLNIIYSAVPFSLVQPSRTVNYIVKVTPDANSATANGVTDINGMTGSIGCGAGLTCTGNTIINNITLPLSLANGALGGSQAAATANQIPVFPGGGGAAVPTLATTWFDNAYCNTIGFLIVRFTGAWTCTRGIPSNPVWWGADPTGAASSTTAFNSAAAASKNVLFPPGTFLFSTAPSTLGSPITVKGSGRDVTTLNVNYATGDFFNITGTKSEFAGFTVTNGVTRTSGAYFDVGVIRTFIHDVYLVGPYVGVNLTTSSTLSRIIDVECRNVTPNATSVNSSCVQIGAAGGGSAPTTIWITRLQSDTDTPASPSFAGISVLSGDSIMLHNASLIHGQFPFIATPGTGDGMSSFKISDSYFDAGSVSSFALSNAGTGSVVRTEIVNSWFGDSSGGQGINLESSLNTGTLDGFTCTNCQFVNNTTGFQISNTAWVNVNLNGGWVSGNNTGILVFPANVNKLKIENMIIGPSNGIALNGTGISVAAGTSDFVTIQNNTITGNTTNTSFGALSGTHNRIEGNAGYNPLGLTAGTSTGTTGSTITAGPSPETHYITQSATFNAAVKSGATTLCTVATATVPCVIELGPNESYTVTFATTQPTFSKFVH